jgi:DNA invertase Pin-like site-specific DNA recombinase
MKVLAPGDVVLVTKLDRLGRSTRELLELIERIGQAGAFFNSLGDPLFDTTTPTGRLLSTLLAAIAEFERELIRERTGEGRKRAKARGVRFGRPSVLTPYQRTEVLARLAEGDSCEQGSIVGSDRRRLVAARPSSHTLAVCIGRPIAAIAVSETRTSIIRKVQETICGH